MYAFLSLIFNKKKRRCWICDKGSGFLWRKPMVTVHLVCGANPQGEAMLVHRSPCFQEHARRHRRFFHQKENEFLSNN